MKHFTPDALVFFRGLARHNAKPWFEAHRDDYERHVKEPMADLVEEMDLRLAGFAPELVGDPKRSVFRLNRDIRFSPDKSPYKTHAACWFFHGGGSSKVGREAHGGGCWMPPRPALQKFRVAIADDPGSFERIVTAPSLRKRMGSLDEEGMLKRVPRGYDADDPAARWLRFQSFTVGRRLSDAQVTGSRLTETLAADFATMLPLVRWLNGVLGLEPARHR